jgi:hypothetical protein
MNVSPRRKVVLPVLALAASTTLAGESAPPAGQDAPPELTMTAPDYPPPPPPLVRAADFRRLLAGRAARQLPDGWEFLFPGDDQQVAWLVEAVQHERGCSQLFQFELSFGRGEGDVRFRIRGGIVAKEVVRGWLAEGTAVVEAATGTDAAAVPMPE